MEPLIHLPVCWLPGGQKDEIPFADYYNIGVPIAPFQARPLTGEWELYNAQTDRSEMHNLADQHPEKFAELAALFDGFWKSTNWKIREDMFSKQIEEWSAKSPSSTESNSLN